MIFHGFLASVILAVAAYMILVSARKGKLLATLDLIVLVLLCAAINVRLMFVWWRP